MVRAIDVLIVAFCAYSALADDVAVCPGEGDRYGDHKCNHDETHRVCAQLLDANGQPLSWGAQGDFWEITGQKAFQWDAEIRANGGDSWCICMWATARLIMAAGCDAVHLHCDSSDIPYILQSYTDGGVDLEPAKHCLQQKCPYAIYPNFIGDSDATVPRLNKVVHQYSGITKVAFVGMSALSVAALACFAVRRMRPKTQSQTPMRASFASPYELEEAIE